VVALATRDDAIRPCFQLLVYPATDMTMSMPSIRSMGEGFFLERDTIAWFRDRYLRDEADRSDPRASPLFADDVRGAPPALVMTAGFDPLRDEGKAYADKLRAAGVDVTYRCYPSLFHGFFSTTGGIDAARSSLADAAAALRGAFA
jgi:acetyl esterase